MALEAVLDPVLATATLPTRTTESYSITDHSEKGMGDNVSQTNTVYSFHPPINRLAPRAMLPMYAKQSLR
jgi:hypothetical protein